MEGPQKRKIMGKVEYPRPTSRNANVSRPASPSKFLAQPTPAPGPSNMLRPKAKVNSTASIRPRKMSTAVSTTSVASAMSRVNSGHPPRAASPFKPPGGTNGATSAPTRPQARITVRPPSKSVAASPDASPDSRRSPAVRSEVGAPVMRRRHGSLSIHHSPTASSLGVPSSASPSSPISDTQPLVADSLDALLVSNVRIKSKVSNTLKASLQANTQPSSPSLSASPPYATTRPFRPRSRPPSISSICLDSPTQAPPKPQGAVNIYPITTCIPAANPHRYAPPRPPPHHGADAEAHVPLPQSPPTSNLSFSSKSSTSRSSVSGHTRASSSTEPTSTSRLNGLGITEGGKEPFPTSQISREPSYEDDSGDDDDSSVDDEDYDSDDPDKKRKAEAKSIRKIADLEITNRSLMAINSTLEATKHRQAKEIRELRRKLRESMLILPPRTFQQVKSTLAKDLDKAEENEDDAEEEEEEEEEEQEDEGDDPAYKRVVTILEGLLEVGRRALETKPEDFVEQSKGGAKVLTAEEVQNWRNRAVSGGSEVTNVPSEYLDTDAAGETSFDSSVSPSHLIVSATDDGATSEEEVEALMAEPVPIPPASIPPITISPS
ncbi:hypothetical protein GLOTRDRAFT_135128 [Gloeophyllum trabeum ATCC 11539]|uniref:Uncharacterized protein n=1 Tax=Gloeophyllum trabeum (strain ATCC 11539 / FP-39264 / Madison 617) TaxID=670483 RepID=S7RZK5_GLOTA|nr:uncharacterized protein GLOTRDRAFT_135128 [Gloeophyllum trabeum ATCC 11539]EPQ60450.1 hypothetical protein GLOTRDRAFT_135128 [Gloeophyllum trabeum ATCC 11539]